MAEAISTTPIVLLGWNSASTGVNKYMRAYATGFGFGWCPTYFFSFVCRFFSGRGLGVGYSVSFDCCSFLGPKGTQSLSQSLRMKAEVTKLQILQ